MKGFEKILDDCGKELNDTDSVAEIYDEDITSTLQETERRNDGIIVDMMVNTNLTRTNEALIFLNDKTRSSNEKRIALKKNSTSALFWAVRERAGDCLIEKMLEYGGMELVIVTNCYNENVLHYAAYCGSSNHVVKKLADIGGRDAILHEDRFGNSAFYCACLWGLSLDVIQRMIEIAGKQAVITTNFKKQVPRSENKDVQALLFEVGGYEYMMLLEEQKSIDLKLVDLLMSNRMEEAENALDDEKRREELLYRKKDLNVLMATIWFIGNASPLHTDRAIRLATKLVDVGGAEFVLMTNDKNSNSVHYAAFNKLPLKIIKHLVDVAGKDSLKQQNGWGNTPLHDAVYREASVEVIEYLAKQSGCDVLTTLNNDDKTPLDLLFHADSPSESHIITLQRTWYELDHNCSRKLSGQMIKKILLWAEKADASAVSENNFVKAILNDQFIWPRYQAMLLADLYAQVAVVIALSPFVTTPCSNYVRIILLVSLSWFAVREVVDFFSTSFKHYANSFENVLDLAQIVLISTFLLQIPGKEESNSGHCTDTGVLISLSLIAWLQLLTIIGQLSYKISIFTYALFQIVFQLVPFLLTVCLVVFAFGQVYYIAGIGSPECKPENWQCKPESALFQSFAMFLTTEFQFLDWDEDKEVGRELAWISFAFAFVVGILFFNILIAVVNNVFTKVSEESEDAFWTTRLNFMVEVISIRNFFIRCFRPKKTFYSMKKSLSQHALNGLKHRKCFNEYDDGWINECREQDMELFFKWWYYEWKKECPPLRTRLMYFYSYACLDEIFFPSKVLHRIVLGYKYNVEVDGWTYLLVGLPLSFIHMAIGMIFAVAVFLLGLLSFGYFWPEELNSMLFFGPLKDQKNTLNESKVHALQDVMYDKKVQALERQIQSLSKQNESLSKQNESLSKQNGDVLSILLKMQDDQIKTNSDIHNMITFA